MALRSLLEGQAVPAPPSTPPTVGKQRLRVQAEPLFSGCLGSGLSLHRRRLWATLPRLRTAAFRGGVWEVVTKLVALQGEWAFC